jgi:outer membrane protein assembly factor BamB
LVVVALAGTGACTSSKSPSDVAPSSTSTPGGSTSTTKPAVGWQTSGINAVSTTITGSGDTVAVVDAAKAPDLQVVVLDAATGKERFRRPWSPGGQLGGQGVGAPAVVGGVVVTMEPAAGTQGQALVALDAQTGDEKWRAAVSDAFAPFACGIYVCDETTGDNAALTARDAATGTVVWTSPGEQSNVVNTVDTLIEQHLGIPPVITSISPQAGAPRWQTDLSATFGGRATTDNGWDAVVVDNTLVAALGDDAAHGAPAGAVGIELANGSVKWKVPTLSLCPLHPRIILLLCGSDSGMSRVDAATGKIAWSVPQFTVPQGDGPVLGMTADGKTIIGVDRGGSAIAVDAARGAILPPTPGQMAWVFIVKAVKAKVTPSGPADDYLGTSDPVPWQPAAKQPGVPVSAAEVPAFVGLTLVGERIFIDAVGNVRALPIDGGGGGDSGL